MPILGVAARIRVKGREVGRMGDGMVVMGLDALADGWSVEVEWRSDMASANDSGNY
jgi:hypothetical protein